MNYVIAPDSFKGSLTSIQAAEIMREAILDSNQETQVTLKPMADGGEGTLDALLASSNGRRVSTTCTGPLGEMVNTSYAIVDKTTAILECASIAGLTQVPLERRDPDCTTSFGIGEVMLDALDNGCLSFILGLGGSATNDGGLGMLLALGMQAWDGDGNEVGQFGSDMLRVNKVSFTGMDRRLANVDIKVACDVDNPLCGEMGASFVYGPQKGASEEQMAKYDLGLDNFGTLIELEVNRSLKEISGAGAAGGLGFALLALGARLVSGAELLGNATNVEESIKHADVVITGEGQSDEQTLYGKAPGYIASIAEKYGVPVLLISGSLGGDFDLLRERFAGCFSIVTKPMSLEECMEQAEELLYEQTKQVIHLLDSIRGKE